MTNFSVRETKCYNIVQIVVNVVTFQLRRSASGTQPVGCATFRNSCGHFEHAGLARNVNRKYSVSLDFNYEARMEIASEGVRQNEERKEGGMRWKRVGARRKEGKSLSLVKSQITEG